MKYEGDFYMKPRARSRSGFTLMELLIVIAIIAVLIAIAIPVFSASLHKARVAADIANVRSYYAAIQAEYLLNGVYDPSIGDDMWTGIRDTLSFPDGAAVKLQAGHCSIIRPEDDKQDFSSGYQLHYFCSKGDCTYTLGASEMP